jgi:hypothetical protein
MGVGLGRSRGQGVGRGGVGVCGWVGGGVSLIPTLTEARPDRPREPLPARAAPSWLPGARRLNPILSKIVPRGYARNS